MPDEIGAIWRGQPEEGTNVELSDTFRRRAAALHASTRGEVLASIAAAVLLAGVTAWRFGEMPDKKMWIALGAVAAWVAISLARFRRWSGASETDIAAPGVEYYRRELERRRDHLRNAWIWHGPLILACAIFATVVWGSGNSGVERAAPLLVLLAAWVGFGVWRRLRLAGEIQRELGELAGR
ncbi:MAG TPA: hypothetical protein VN736_02065 [Candidatus Limnocylindrales bacterium]|nr:hypothetical protein [Candidatus Limnocylindrales bacterium]